MRPIIVKCVEKQTKDTVNGPLTKVTLVPAGVFNTAEGSITFFVHDQEDLEAYQVGATFRLTPEFVGF